MRSVSDIVKDLQSFVAALKRGETPVFKRVDAAPISTGDQLINSVASLSPLPSAIVMSGGCDCDGFERKLSLAIIVAAEFSSTIDGKAANVLALVDVVADAFKPDQGENGDALHVCIEGVYYVLKGWEPIDNPRLKSPVYVIELEANQL